jgi:hypothetical protein
MYGETGVRARILNLGIRWEGPGSYSVRLILGISTEDEVGKVPETL